MFKKLFLTLSLFFCLSGCIGEKYYFQRQGLEKYSEYYSGEIVEKDFFMKGNYMISKYFFDLDGDKKKDAVEGYAVSIDDFFEDKIPFPFFYGFDTNKNNKFEDDEVFYDRKRDGFNGNETRGSLI